MDKKEEFFLKDTQQHVDNVKKLIDAMIDHLNNKKKCIEIAITRLKARAAIHDYTKFSDPEKKIFIEMTPKLKDTVYNSPEYKGFLKEMKTALDHHYGVHRHHPEHHEKGIDGMNLVDIMELFCDWKAASMRHAEGDFSSSVNQNIKRFNLSPQIVSILKNSIDLFKHRGKTLEYINLNEPVIEINHKDLERFGDSLYKSTCPKCEEGILLMGRDQKSFVLEEYDRCVLCGQHYKYKDIKKLRKSEGNEYGFNIEEI